MSSSRYLCPIVQTFTQVIVYYGQCVPRYLRVRNFRWAHYPSLSKIEKKIRISKWTKKCLGQYIYTIIVFRISIDIIDSRSGNKCTRNTEKEKVILLKRQELLFYEQFFFFRSWWLNARNATTHYILWYLPMQVLSNIYNIPTGRFIKYIWVLMYK